MLISGKEAYSAVLDGQEVEWLDNDQWSMFTMSTAWAPSELISGKYKFRVKPVVASVMTFDEWYKEENWGPAFGDNGDFHYGASVVWDYKQAEIDALQKRIAIYEKHISAIKNIHEKQFNNKSDTAWVLGSLDGFFECLKNDLKGDKND